MNLFKQKINRIAFDILCSIGKPFGGIRPRRIYHWIGRKAFKTSEYGWYKNSWNVEMYLSPHYFLDRNIIAFGTYDFNLHLLLEKLLKPGMICMDVGANIGEMATHMAIKVGHGGRVYAFEPLDNIFQRLLLNINRNQMNEIIYPYPVAIAKTTGRQVLSAQDNSNDNQGMASLLPRDDALLPQKKEVPVVSLDDFVAREGINSINLIKIDVQGGEIDVLEGGSHVFSVMSPDLLIEVSPEDLMFISKDSRDLCIIIEKYGYAIYKTSGGKVCSRIYAKNVPRYFNASNIYCTKK